MATAAMTVERKLPRNSSTTSDASSEPRIEVLLQAASIDASDEFA